MAEQTPHDNDLLVWEALEYEHHEKNRAWFFVAGVVTLAVIVWSILDRDWTTAIVFALLIGVVYMFAHERPGVHEIRITSLGIHVGEKFFPYHNISSFWIIYNDSVKTFNFQTAGKTSVIVTAQLGDQDPNEVRKLMVEEIPEQGDREEPMLDKIARMLRL